MSTAALSCHSHENGIAALLDQATYEVLLRRGAAILRHESYGYLFEAGDLVHECFLRMTRSAVPVRFHCTAHLLAVATIVMRRIMIDHSRSTKAAKNGVPVPLGTVALAAPEGIDAIILGDALARLADCEDRLFRIVQMRFFGGFAIDEIAAALDISSRTVKRDWSAARERLQDLLG